jgi:2-polyprenyl-6-methoxyphenol hydroxylase-like FAD-dependent oxidoreductase
MRVLISGAGIAGPTLAYWLARYGFKPTIIEIAPRLRTGGYVIDFWGAGFDIADRMGLLPEISRKGYMVQEVRVGSRSGRRVAGFPADAFSRMTHGRFVSLPRGEVAASIFGKIEGKVEVIFGDSVDRVEQTEGGVKVTLERGVVREFDLVVGADGLHSRVRELAFGEESRFEKYLGYKVAAFEVKGYRPRDELVYGDAASYVSLLAGQGSALAMVAAYILAGELHRAKGNYVEAFARYQNLFAPFVFSKQKDALRFAGAFAPKSRFALFLRNQIFKLMAIPWVADLAVGRDLADKISLPDYE